MFGKTNEKKRKSKESSPAVRKKLKNGDATQYFGHKDDVKIKNNDYFCVAECILLLQMR